MLKIINRFLFWAIISLSIAAAGVASAADAIDWTVRTVSGNAELQAAGPAWRPLSEGQKVDVGNAIRTAENSRVVLERNDESVTIAAKSSFEIRPASNGMLTSIFQKVGTLMFKVHKRPNQHFEVTTPYLVAVVKGTTFAVSVDANGGAVHVTEGLVEVKGNDRPEKLLLHPGQTGTIDAAPGSKLQSGSAAPDSSAPQKKQSMAPAIKRRIQSAALDIEKASNGLISSAGGLVSQQTASAAEGIDATLDGLGGAIGNGGAGAGGSTGGGGLGGAVGAVGGVGGAVSGLSGGLGGAVSGLSGGLGGAVSGLSGGLGGAIGGDLGGAVAGVGGAAGGAVAGAGGAAGGAVGGVGGAVGGVVGGLGGGLGGLLGGGS